MGEMIDAPEKLNLTPLQQEWDALLFSVKRSVRYHTRRRKFFEKCGSTTSFLVVFAGSGTGASALFGNNRTLTAVLGAFVAALSAADLVLGYSRKARQYQDLARQFSKLQQEMVQIGKNPTDEELKLCTNQHLKIEEEEPPTLHILNILCHNELARALGRDKHITKVPLYKRWLCHFFDFDTSDCQPCK